MTIPIWVKSLKGEAVSFSVDPASTIGELKQLIQEKFDVKPDCQRLIFAGKQLSEDLTIAQVGVQKEATIHLLCLPPQIQEEEEEHSNSKEEVEEENCKEKEEDCKEEEEEEEQQQQQQQLEQSESSVYTISYEEKPLAVVGNELIVSDKPSYFKLHERKKSGLVLFGFQDLESKNFLFSSPPLQGIFHGKFGGNQVFCAYDQFSYGEEFIIEDEGRIQCYRNGRHWVVRDNVVEITKFPKRASKFQLKKVSE